MSALFDWIRSHEPIVTVVGLLSIAFFVGSLLLTPVLVARIPVDYFATEKAPPSKSAARHPMARIALRVARNLIGLFLIVIGVAMLFLPGQGILTILMGFLLSDYPGKRALELRLLRRRPIRRALDWMRRRSGKPPLKVAGVEPEEPPT